MSDMQLQAAILLITLLSYTTVPQNWRLHKKMVEELDIFYHWDGQIEILILFTRVKKKSLGGLSLLTHAHNYK